MSVVLSREPKHSPDYSALYPGAIEIGLLLLVMRRRWRSLLGGSLLGLAAGAGYLVVTPPQYVASALLSVEQRHSTVPGGEPIINDPSGSGSFVDSRVELLKSDRLPLSLVRSGQVKAEEGTSFLGPLLDVFGLGGDGSSIEAETQELQRNLHVERLGQTSMIRISYTAEDRQRAADVANTVARAFLEDQEASRARAEERAGTWLEGRIADVRAEAESAERRLQQFKADHGFIDSGTGFLEEKQVGEISSQLSIARSGTAEAKARLDWIERARAEPHGEALPMAVLKDAGIAKLYAEMIQVEKNEAEIASKLPSTNKALDIIRGEKGRIMVAITGELQRLAAAYRSEYSIARSRDASLGKQLDELVAKANGRNEMKGDLSELESAARVSRDLYDKLLERRLAMSQVDAFPLSRVEVVAEATPPLQKSHPRSLFVLALAAVAGFALSGARILLSRNPLAKS